MSVKEYEGSVNLSSPNPFLYFNFHWYIDFQAFHSHFYTSSLHDSMKVCRCEVFVESFFLYCQNASWQLTTIILYEPQVWELGPHVTLDAVETSSEWSNLSCEHWRKHCLLVAQRGRRMAAVHGDRRSLHWGNRECKPKIGTKTSSSIFPPLIKSLLYPPQQCIT